MGNQVSNRFYIDPPQQEREKIKFALRQATNLWNCLVSHIGDEVTSIARSKGDSESIEKMIHDIVMMAYKYLILGEDVGIDFPVTDSWRSRIKYIKKLPETVCHSRMLDLIQAYIYVHRKYSADIDYPYAPKCKIKGSTETMRFTWPNFTIDNGITTLLMVDGSSMRFNIDGIERIEKKPVSITVTKKRASRSKSIEIDAGKTRSQFFVSLY